MGCSTGPVRYGQALAECEAVASVGSKGDSYDNALAEALNSMYKTELILYPGPLAGHLPPPLVATAGWVHWAGTIRPHSAIGMPTPAEHETARAPDAKQDYQKQPQPTIAEAR